MTEKMEELFLEQLFKIYEELKSCVKKDDLKNFATKDDLKAMEQRMYAKMDARFAEQTKDIAEELTMIFESAGRIHDNIEARVNKRTDQKIEQALQY